MKKTIRLERMFGFLRIGRGNRRRIFAIAIAAMMLILPMSLQTSAANVSVEVNGRSLYADQDLLKSGITYVPLRAFADAVYDGFTISWSGVTRTATVRHGEFVLKARVGDRYVTANGERIYSTVSNLLIANRIFVPVRSLCTAMGLDVNWNSSRRLVTVSGRFGSAGENNSPVGSVPEVGDSDTNAEVNSTDLYWLARIIHAESSGEPMAGKIAVGTVIMNRVKSSMYPNTIYDVIFDRKHGTQFTPVASGTIYNDPSADSIEAARRVLNGERTDLRILFFVNEKLAPNNWISQNRTYIITIGNHKFYA